MGNLHSVGSALKHVSDDCEIVISADPAAVAAADRLVFPGVGAIRDCMSELARLNLDESIAEYKRSGRPLLGICVGMQALLEHSEENDGTDCLGLLPGQVRRFPDGMSEGGERLKVPHMGWNIVARHGAHPLWRNIDPDSRFYFVHSYYVDPAEQEQVTAHCDYGCRFAAAMADGNLFAVQFHPEKSDRVGLQLLRNFVDWDGQSTC